MSRDKGKKKSLTVGNGKGHRSFRSVGRRLVMALLGLILICGVGLLLYPTVSNLWNSYHQTRAIVSYTEQTSEMDEKVKEALFRAAAAYNETLAQKDVQSWELSKEERAVYESLLAVTAKGIMGYVEIPGIGEKLPIYHGTSEAVLQEGVGHLEGSSLPVGGASVHTVISGHRGLPSARLFTDLDKMQKGDIFYLHVLEETLAYEVDQIQTVEPHETQALEIVEGQDLCTLVTCTPYGINTHRLLVRGHRTELPQELTAEDETKPEENCQAVPWWLWVALAFAALLLAVLLVLLWRKRRKSSAHKNRTGR